MKPADNTPFDPPLSSLELDYWHRLEVLFQQVHPQKPEKGIQALLLRARDVAKTQELPLADALQQMFDGATERTLRRVALLGQQCRLPTASPEAEG